MARGDLKHVNTDPILRNKKHEETLKKFNRIREASNNYNRENATQGKFWYINNCIFNEYGEMIQEPSIPENADSSFISEFNRTKRVAGYAFDDGKIASKSKDLVIPDKYKTMEEIRKEVLKIYNDSHIEIDDILQREIDKEIKKRFDIYESYLYRKFFDAGYIYGMSHSDEKTM